MGAYWLFDMDGRPPETSLLEDAVTYAAKNVDMSEWLRRQTRNLLGFACAGSNPAVDVLCFFFTGSPCILSLAYFYFQHF